MDIFPLRFGSRLQFGAAAFAILLASGVAEASVISPTPTPVPANGEYAVAAPGCFTAEGVCVGPGTFSYTAISSTFSPLGQDIVVDGVYTSVITDLSHAPLGLISMTGTGEESILGRLGPSDTGTWSTNLDSLAISGTVLGDSVSVGLDPSNPTTGQTSIAAMGPDFLITSFFDVFVEITIDTASGPVTDAIGPVRADLVPTAEPASLALLALPLAGLLLSRRQGALGWRRR